MVTPQLGLGRTVVPLRSRYTSGPRMSTGRASSAPSTHSPVQWKCPAAGCWAQAWPSHNLGQSQQLQAALELLLRQKYFVISSQDDIHCSKALRGSWSKHPSEHSVTWEQTYLSPINYICPSRWAVHPCKGQKGAQKGVQLLQQDQWREYAQKYPLCPALLYLIIKIFASNKSLQGFVASEHWSNPLTS